MKFFAGLGVFTLVWMYYYIPQERDMDFIYGIIYSYFAFFALHSMLWLFRYRYLAREGRELSEGVVFVGSSAMSLGDQTPVDMPPADIYALHCSYETNANDPYDDASEPSLAAGRQRLAEFNPGVYP